ncbi:cytochrome P450 [Deinococcus sp. YIM 134068]|uniref:cytochrome P450 n=1 Tax=Deinococcus lichenicola TaxID=3118910 RepID=UPI002F94F26E
MHPTPHISPLQVASGMLTRGYPFISETCARLETDVFTVHAGPLDLIFLRGAETARLFYDQDRFRRGGALPLRVRKPIFGAETVHIHDGETHRWRKSLFLFLLEEGPVEALVREFTRAWHARAVRWETQGEVHFLREIEDVLCRAVCDWAGVPLPNAELRLRASDFVAMFDAPVAVGPRYWRGLLGRRRGEAWLGDLIERVRAGTLDPPEGSALRRVALFRGPDGALLDPSTAVSELINILRPTVAVSRYLTFAALALHDHPEERARVAGGDPAYAEAFTHEVRRVYPFIPTLAARVREGFEWRGHAFPKNALAILDLYGTNHDGRVWADPDEFRPERFLAWDGDAFTFIPQGGSEYVRHHRCPGERITVALMNAGTRLLARELAYEVPRQDLTVRLNRIPALPESGFVLRKVRRVPETGAAPV